MNTEPGTNSDSDDTLTSSDLSDYDGDRDDDYDFDETESCRSLVFSVTSNRSTATVKSSKSKKKVRFKPGDSLVLVYVIPNREMLGLHSASESSDSEYSASDSDDEDDDNDNKDNSDNEDNDKDNESDDNDDDDDDSSDEEDSDGDSDEKDNNNNESKRAKQKPIGRLLSVRKVNPRKPVDFPKPIRRQQPDNVQKLISLDVPPSKQKQKSRKGNKPREKKERVKTKRELNKTADKPKKDKTKKARKGAIKADIDKVKGPKKNKSRLLEIKATVDSNHKTNVSVPKLVYKSDFKPSVVDVNGSNLAGSNTKPLIARSKLQPTSIRLSKRPDSGNGSKRPDSGNGIQNKVVTPPKPVEKPRSPARVVAASYDSLSSVMPSSYVAWSQAFLNNHTVDESIQRLDPKDMNASNKRLYAWQIANGNITSQTLRTPSILPFLDSLKSSLNDVPS